MVNVEKFIQRLPDGYGTKVGEGGEALSSGERQLLAFARALYINPRILILDEATSHVDPETERLGQEGLARLLKDRTGIVIAHRLSTIRDCDLIIAMDNGAIVEMGTHEQLLQKQYQKPMQEFSALQEYFENAAKRPSEKPKSNFGFFKRMFSKDFREAEKEYLREEGARRAFSEAQGKFESVYASAQSSMRSVNLDADAQLKKLNDLIEDKQLANAEDLSSFFDKARQALRTHQDVLDFEPEPIPQTQRVQP